VTARSDAQARHERAPARVLELDLDYCQNTYGVAPCTAGRRNSGILQAGGASIVRLAAGASSADDAYNGMTLRSTGGTGSGQERRIVDYVGATREATLAAAFSPALDATTTYDVIDRPNGCYNVFLGPSPCQDKPNYARGVKTVRFCSRGMPIPPGEQVRPYLVRASAASTEISIAKGLAARAKTSVELADEPALDDLDKYAAERAAPAQGTYLTRLIARNPNAAGRFARLRNGYVMYPWDWATFQTELLVIDALNGPDRDGRVKVELADAVKMLDRRKIPALTDGKLAADLPDVSTAGFAVSGGASTVELSASASQQDDAYNGQEIWISGGAGVGQRRVIADYAGTSRTATVSPAWSVVPDATSFCQVSPLALLLTAGKGAQYPAPGAEPQYVRIGDEVIRYSARGGDTLSWPDSTYREQFGTARAEHKANDAVQLCRVWIDKSAGTVVRNLLNEGGLADAYIDLAGLAVEETEWLQAARITACIADPETGSDLLADLFKDLNMMCWWHAVEQKVRFKVDMPESKDPQRTLRDEHLMLAETQVESLDRERITRAAIDLDLASATADRGKRTSYRTVEMFIDLGAEGANEHGDVRQDLRQSRWLSAANAVHARALTVRKVRRLRDAPKRIRLALDPRDEVSLGAIVDLRTRKIPGADGAARTVRCRVLKLSDAGAQLDCELRTNTFAARYGFIAPNGLPDYALASEVQRERAFIAPAGGAMPDGSPPYIII